MRETMPVFLLFGFFCCILVIAYLSWQWESNRSQKLIEQWTSEHGYELISANRSYWKIGTPFWATSKSQRVYRLVARDQQGNVYSGYALCGGRFMGLWSDRVEVKWDDAPVEQWKEKAKYSVEKRKNDEYPIL
jgi:hypothetical protein